MDVAHEMSVFTRGEAAVFDVFHIVGSFGGLFRNTIFLNYLYVS